MEITAFQQPVNFRAFQIGLHEQQQPRELAIDFDGVVHRYSKGWQGGEIYDVPMEGIENALKELREQYSLTLFTARDEIEPVISWLGRYRLKGYFDNVTNVKPPKALAYIDDKAIRFSNWENTIEDIKSYVEKSLGISLIKARRRNQENLFEGVQREFAPGDVRRLERTAGGKLRWKDADSIIESQQIDQPKVIAEPFYYKSERAIQTKMPEVATADHIKGILADVPAEEKEDLGINKYLSERGDDKITKQEILDFIKANDISIETVWRGGETRNIIRQIEALGYDVVDEYDTVILEKDGEFVNIEDEPPDVQALYYEYDQMVSGSREARYNQWQLGGDKNNYRELLFKIPTKIKLPEGIIDSVEAAKIINSGGEVAEIYGNGNWEWVSSGKTNKSFLYTENPEDFTKKELKGLMRQNGSLFHTKHWDETNVIAHARINDRTLEDGRNIIFIEEVQSDWHQEGRKSGYIGIPRPKILKEIKDLEEQKRGVMGEFGKLKEERAKRGFNLTDPSSGELEQFDRANPDLAKVRADLINRLNPISKKLEYTYAELENPSPFGVPNAPFKTSWHELVLKKLLRLAAEERKDGIAWTTGEIQSSRYDLSKQVDEIRYAKDGENLFYLEVGKDGLTEYHKTIPANDLDRYVGKDVANKIIEGAGELLNEDWKEEGNTFRSLKGDDLKVGGEGMKGFYDKMIPDFLNKYVKKYGGKVSSIEIKRDPLFTDNPDTVPINEDDTVSEEVHYLEITPALREHLLYESQPLFGKSKMMILLKAFGKQLSLFGGDNTGKAYEREGETKQGKGGTLQLKRDAKGKGEHWRLIDKKQKGQKGKATPEDNKKNQPNTQQQPAPKKTINNSKAYDMLVGAIGNKAVVMDSAGSSLGESSLYLVNENSDKSLTLFFKTKNKDDFITIQPGQSITANKDAVDFNFSDKKISVSLKEKAEEKSQPQPSANEEYKAKRMQEWGDMADNYIEAAQAQKDQFLLDLDYASLANGLKAISHTYRKYAVKSKDSIINKFERNEAKGQPHKNRQLSDILRGTIVVNNPDQYKDVMKSLKERGYDVWNDDLTDLYQDKNPGYKHVAVKLTKGDDDPVIKELLFMTPAMYEAKFGFGHDLYDLQKNIDITLGTKIKEGHNLYPHLISFKEDVKRITNDFYTKAYLADSKSAAAASAPPLAQTRRSSFNFSSGKFSKPPKRLIRVLRSSLKAILQPVSASLKNSSGDMFNLAASTDANFNSLSSIINPTKNIISKYASKITNLEKSSNSGTNIQKPKIVIFNRVYDV